MQHAMTVIGSSWMQLWFSFQLMSARATATARPLSSGAMQAHSNSLSGVVCRMHTCHESAPRQASRDQALIVPRVYNAVET